MKKLLVVFVLGCLLTTSYAQQDIKDHTIMFETLFGRHRVNSALGVTTDIAWILVTTTPLQPPYRTFTTRG